LIIDINTTKYNHEIMCHNDEGINKDIHYLVKNLQILRLINQK